MHRPSITSKTKACTQQHCKNYLRKCCFCFYNMTLSCLWSLIKSGQFLALFSEALFCLRWTDALRFEQKWKHYLRWLNSTGRHAEGRWSKTRGTNPNDVTLHKIDRDRLRRTWINKIKNTNTFKQLCKTWRLTDTWKERDLREANANAHARRGSTPVAAPWDWVCCCSGSEWLVLTCFWIAVGPKLIWILCSFGWTQCWNRLHHVLLFWKTPLSLFSICLLLLLFIICYKRRCCCQIFFFFHAYFLLFLSSLVSLLFPHPHLSLGYPSFHCSLEAFLKFVSLGVSISYKKVPSNLLLFLKNFYSPFFFLLMLPLAVDTAHSYLLSFFSWLVAWLSAKWLIVSQLIWSRLKYFNYQTNLNRYSWSPEVKPILFW